MYGDAGYGEATLSENVTPDTLFILDSTDAFLAGFEIAEKEQLLFINGEFSEVVSFFQACYVFGKEGFQTNEDDNWGTIAEHDADVAAVGGSIITNIYHPIKSYINGVAAPSLTKVLTAYIVQKAHLMNVPTIDGRENEHANIALDYGPYQNHMRLFNFPAWIDGPGL